MYNDKSKVTGINLCYLDCMFARGCGQKSDDKSLSTEEIGETVREVPDVVIEETEPEPIHEHVYVYLGFSLYI